MLVACGIQVFICMIGSSCDVDESFRAPGPGPRPASHTTTHMPVVHKFPWLASLQRWATIVGVEPFCVGRGIQLKVL